MSFWYVVVSVQGHIYTAADEIFALGADVSVPEDRLKVRLATGGNGIISKPLIDPYFFAYFDASRNEEIAAIRACRGVEDVLCNYVDGDRGGPQSIPESVIYDFRRWHLQAMRGITTRAKRGRTDLQLKGTYRILRHVSLEGKEGELVAAGRGLAHMRVGPFLVSLPDGDIILTSGPKIARLQATG